MGCPPSSGAVHDNASDVAVLDVAAVLAEVDGDAVSAGAFAEEREGDGVGLDVAADGGPGLPVAGLADGGAVIDVDAEENHGRRTKQDWGGRQIRKKLCLPDWRGAEFLGETTTS